MSGSEDTSLSQRRKAVAGRSRHKIRRLLRRDLAKSRRQLIRLLDKLDNLATRGAGLVARIAR